MKTAVGAVPNADKGITDSKRGSQAKAGVQQIQSAGKNAAVKKTEEKNTVDKSPADKAAIEKAATDKSAVSDGIADIDMDFSMFTGDMTDDF